MSFKKVKELANKFATLNINEQYNAQRAMLEKFLNHFTKKYNALLSEMEGDIFVTKEKKLDKDIWKEFVKLWRSLRELKLRNETAPYDWAQSVIDLVEDRPTQTILKNLEFLIQDHLKKNELDFGKTPMFEQAKINSLKHLVQLAQEIKLHLKSNPLLKDPRTLSTVPPKGLRIINDPDFKSFSPEEKTNPGGK